MVPGWRGRRLASLNRSKVNLVLRCPCILQYNDIYTLDTPLHEPSRLKLEETTWNEHVQLHSLTSKDIMHHNIFPCFCPGFYM
jgi:hypothetical protein